MKQRHSIESFGLKITTYLLTDFHFSGGGSLEKPQINDFSDFIISCGFLVQRSALLSWPLHHFMTRLRLISPFMCIFCQAYPSRVLHNTKSKTERRFEITVLALKVLHSFCSGTFCYPL